MAKFNKPSGDRKPFREQKSEKRYGSKYSGDRKKPFRKKEYSDREDNSSEEGRAENLPAGKAGKQSYKQKRSFTRNKEFRGNKGKDEKSFYEKKGGRDHKRPFKRDYEKREGVKRDGFGDKKYGDKKYGDKDRGERKFGDKKYAGKDRGDKKFGDRESGEKKYGHGERGERKYGDKKYGDKKYTKKDRYDDEKPRFHHDKDEKFRSHHGKDEKPRFRHEDKFEKKESKFASEQKRLRYEDLEEGQGFRGSYDKNRKFDKHSEKKSDDGTIRLNKYLAHAGIASRREADTLIKSGVIKVNGVPVTEMGFKVKPGDTVTYGDAAVKNEKKVYLLLNKPKDYISTVDDPQERKTVMDLIAGACKERVYPVGRLDRNTTGLLLLTNDGELTKKLTHPKHNIKKIYHVSLNKGLKPDDFKAIIEGVELEDGPIHADDLAFVGEGKKEVGIEIHSGRNRVVRRIFEHLGYDVEKLDRVSFAGLTKKDLPRGKYRFLNPKEVGFLHMIG